MISVFPSFNKASTLRSWLQNSTLESWLLKNDLKSQNSTYLKIFTTHKMASDRYSIFEQETVTRSLAKDETISIIIVSGPSYNACPISNSIQIRKTKKSLKKFEMRCEAELLPLLIWRLFTFSSKSEKLRKNQLGNIEN